MNPHSILSGVVALMPGFIMGGSWYTVSASLLLLSNAWIFLLHWSFRLLLRRLIRRRSVLRRKQLLLAVEKNKEEELARRKQASKSEDEDWEHVHSSSEEKKGRGVSPDTKFNGFIGFFHPFA